MRKKIATLLLAFALILPCSLLFTACLDDDGTDKAKVTSISAELESTDYTMTDNTITIPWGVKVELDSSDFTITATLDNGETKVISEKTETKDGFTFSSTIPNDAITPLGEYLITFSHEGVEEDVEIDVNVVKANVDMTGVDWNYTNSFTYDKTEKVVELTGLPAGVSVEYKTKLSTESGNGEIGNRATNAGAYTTTAIFTYSDTEHYNAIPNKVINWEIEKADIVVSSVTMQPFTYDGTEKTATITSNLPEGVEATITGEKIATNADTYDIVISFEYIGADSANYNPIANLNASWTINPAKFTAVGEVVLKEDYDLIYNGANQAVELDLTGLDTNNVEVVAVTGLTAKNVGTHTAIVELAYIGASTNYNRVDNISVEWTIGKAPLTITAKDKTITYGDSAANDNVTYTGLVAEETASVLVGSLVYDYDGYEIGSNVGSYDITPSGLTSPNYEISFVKGTLTVEKKALTIKANDATIDYNTNATNNGVEQTGLIAGDTIAELGTLAYNYGEYVKGSDVGTYDITVSGLEAENYIISYEKGTLTVEKIDVDVDITGVALVDNSIVYTGAELSVEVDETTLPDGVIVTNIETKDNTPINVGSYTAVIYLQYFDTKNYNPMSTIERTWNIEKATVASFDGVALKETELTYTGLEQEVEIINIPAGAKIDTVDGNKGINADVYTVVVVFICADTENYNEFEPVSKTYTWHVMPATLTVAALDNTIAYGEQPSHNGYTITGFVNNETESVLEGEISYSYTYSYGEDVGTYTITPSGFTSGNYTINFVGGELIVEKGRIDFAGIDWIKNSPYTYTGSPIKLVLGGDANIVEIIYSYTKGGEVVENPTNVGTYVARAEINLSNDNYEIVNNNITDFEYEIAPKAVDCSALTWVDAIEYTFDGQEHKPTLVEIPEGVEVTYYYFEGEDTQIPAETVLNVGTYTAMAEVQPASENYIIANYTQLQNITFTINRMQIDISDVEWETLENTVYTGEAIKPVLTGTENIPADHMTFEYYYTEGTIMYPVKDVVVEANINPVNVGEYEAWAFITLTYQSQNYEIVNNGYLFLSDSLRLQFVIEQAEVVLGEMGWNIDSLVINKDEYSQYSEAVVEYNEEPIVITAVGNFDMFDIEYQLDYVTTETISIESAGYYNICATITLKEEYQQNYYFGNFNLVLWLEVKANPFELITIDGEEVSYAEFAAKERFEYLSEIEFALKDGYTASDNNSNEISSIIIDGDYKSIFVVDGNLNQVFSKHIYDYYYMDEIVVEDTKLNPSYDNNLHIGLADGQTEIEITFNQKYLAKYASNIKYEIYYEEGGFETGAIQSVPFIVENAASVAEIRIYLNTQQYNVDLCAIYIHRPSLISEVVYKTVSLNNVGVNNKTLELGDYWIDLYDEILVEFYATVESGYSVKYFTDYNMEQEIDLTNLNNLYEIHIAVYDGDKVAETREVVIYSDLHTASGERIADIDTVRTTENEYSLVFENTNSNLTITSLLNGNEVLQLTNDITVADYVLTIQYEAKAYTYTKQVSIIKTLNVMECVTEDVANSGSAYLTNSTTNQQYDINIYENSVNLYQYYDASNIRNIDLDSLEFPVAEGYTVSNKELLSISGNPYLKLTLTSEMEMFALTESEYTLYLLLEIAGKYDNDLSGRVCIYDIIYGDVPIDREKTEIDIDIATQGIDVTLNNYFAKAVILDDYDNVLKESENGYFSDFYNFKATGTYYLVLTATDGTMQTYTINVTGEILPTLEVVVGDITLSQNIGPQGPVEGDFKWEMLDEYGTEMSFTAMLGDEARSLISDGKVTIASLRSSMLAAATIYNSNDEPIVNLQNFTLTVLGDEAAPYVMFYAIASVQGQTTKSYIILYLCDELPAQKVLEVVIGENTFTQVLDPEGSEAYGDFEMYLLSDSNTGMEMTFTACLGTYEEIPQTLTLDSIYCVYEGVMTDLVSGQTFTAINDVTLEVGVIENNVTPCVAYSIAFTPQQGYTVIVNVVLYLIDKTDVPYPVQITIGENSYDLKLNVMSFDFGDFTMDMDNYYLYITETAEAQSLTQITVTLDRVWTNYSYMVLIGDAYDRYVQDIEVNHVFNSDYIDALLADGTQAFRVTDAENLTMTIPVQFVEGLAYFDIAVEGFVGYLEEDYVHDMTFVRCYIIIDGIGNPPQNNNGEDVNPGGGNGSEKPEIPEELPLDTEFIITIGSETLMFDELLCYDTEYIGEFAQHASELINEEDMAISATITTNLEGEFGTMGNIYEITPNEEMEITIQPYEEYGDLIYVLVYNEQFYFIFTFADSMISQ